MESLLQVLIKWEIQLLVLLSFILQVFLFFTGNIRRRSTNTPLRFSVWVAYLGADLVAVYTLGFLSRQDGCHTMGGTHQLAFLWAPFLIHHLGGQDTVTAFAIEDNNLWLRHLLNLVVQVALALYVFWKSTGRDHMQLLVIGIFMFVAGIVKYVERTLALMYGDLKNNKSSIGEENEKQHPQVNWDDGYSVVVCFALHSAPIIRELFAGRTTFEMEKKHVELHPRLNSQLPKLLEIELAMVYDDLYTKAMVLRTRIGIILRCLSQLSIVVALVLFLISNKQSYSRVDVAITYTLFIGGFFLEGFAIFMTVMVSPWTWAWLEARKCRRLARMSWLLFSSNIGWAEKRPLWSNSVGQYSLLSYMGCDQSRLSERVKILIRKMASIVGVRKEKFLWMSKLLDTEFVEVNETIMNGLVQGVKCLYDLVQTRNFPEVLGEPSTAEQWPNLRPLLKDVVEKGVDLPFGHLILALHIFTEVHLSRYPLPPPLDMDENAAAEATTEANAMAGTCPLPPSLDMDENAAAEATTEANAMAGICPFPPLDMDENAAAEATTEANAMAGICPLPPPLDMDENAAAEATTEANAMAGICRKLSNYTLYLLVTHPSMLQFIGSTEDTLEYFLKEGYLTGNGDKDAILREASEKFSQQWGFPEPQPCKETLQEIQDMWTGLLLYAASKSRPEVHAAQLSRGGELFTFAWLLMAHHRLGDSGTNKIQLGDVFGIPSAGAHLSPSQS